MAEAKSNANRCQTRGEIVQIRPRQPRTHCNRKNVNKSKGPDTCPGLWQIRRVRDPNRVYSSSSGCSSGGARPSRPFKSSSSVIRSTATSVSSASTLAPAEPISGTVSGSGSSTSTNFCRECTSSSRRSSGEIEESAISRSETTGFLSLSRTTVSCDPDEIIRARCSASRTRSNRLSTLSMQSSTVTRAIECRSVNVGYDGLDMLIMQASYRVKRFFARPICDLGAANTSATPASVRQVGPQSHKLRLLDKKTLYCATKDIPLLPLPPQICGSVYQTDLPRGLARTSRTARSAA